MPPARLRSHGRSPSSAACAGSVIRVTPATQPNRPPPSVTMMGKRSIQRMMSCDENTISGMLTSSPSTSSSRLPWAAAAMPMTLSRLITRSATMITRTACQKPDTSTDPPSASSAGTISRTAIHSSKSAPTVLIHGRSSSSAANTVSVTRIAMAAAVPISTARRRCSSGSLRAASAITTALSPERTMSMPMICSRPTQNSGVCNS